MASAQDEHYMSHALRLAEYARDHDEVPVGAVLVLNGHIIGEGWNQPISTCDPCAHAEIIALRAGARHIDNYRLLESTLYVTLEPCPMCAGALVHSRIKRLVFGAYDQRAGAVCSVFELLQHPQLNHRVTWEGGVKRECCANLLSTFFKNKRD